MKGANEINEAANNVTPNLTTVDNLDNIEEISYLLENSNLEVNRDDKCEILKEDPTISPIICKSPRPTMLLFNESFNSLSPNPDNKGKGLKRLQNFSPREVQKRVKILHSINSVTIGDNFKLDGTPLNVTQIRVRKNLMDYYGNFSTVENEPEIDSVVIEPETTLEFLALNHDDLFEHFESDVGYMLKDKCQVF